ILVDRRPYFIVGFRKTWALAGISPLEAGQRPIADLTRFGIQVIQESVTALDPTARAVEIGGRRMEADALVVALGAEIAPDAVPGLAQHAFNVYESQDIPRAAESLRELRVGKLC